MTAEPTARVLVVDDEEAMLELISASLSPLGFYVRVTSSGAEALQILTEEAFDIVVSDLVMPGVDGCDLLEVMRSRGDKTPVLFLSGSGAVPVVVKLMKSGASGFLEKPFAPAELKRELMAVLQEARSRRVAPAQTESALPPDRAQEISTFSYLGAQRSESPDSGVEEIVDPRVAAPEGLRPTRPPPRPLPSWGPSAPTSIPPPSRLPWGVPLEVAHPAWPTQLGRYTLIEELATGGMGKVYRAHDPVLDRQVAVKVVLAPSSSVEKAEFATRFRREAVALAKLRHPHIVAVHDGGVDGPSGVPFLVMELVEGRSLGDIVEDDERLPVPRALRFAGELADALAFAHQHGIVHRDVKPDNVLVDADDHVHLIDFGVASTRDSEPTMTRLVIGTPSYLSPEAAAGSPVDWRADQFSLATLILEMLSGKRVFRGEEVPHTVRNVKEANVPTLVELGLPDVPPGLQALLLRMHAKDPAARFQDEEEVVAGLRALLAASVAGETESGQAGA